MHIIRVDRDESVRARQADRQIKEMEFPRTFTSDT